MAVASIEDEAFHRCYELPWRSRFANMWSTRARALNSVEPAIDHEGDAPLRQTRAKQRAIAVSQCVIQDGT